MIKQILWFSFLQFVYVSAVRIPLLGRMTGSPASPIAVPLQNFRNRLYYGNIALGTPPKKFVMAFDSGSTDIIVKKIGFKRNCNLPDENRQQDCLTKDWAVFNPSASETYEKIEGTFAAKFVDNSEQRGYIATDILEIGEENSKIRVKVPVGISEVMTNDAVVYDGVFGLGFNMGSAFDPKIITPFECMVSQADLPPRFSFYAKREETPGEGIGGEFYVGGYNPANLASNIKTTANVFKMQNLLYFGWKIIIDRITVGGKSVPVPNLGVDGDGNPVVIAHPDTGASSIGAPPQVMNVILQYVFPAGIPQDVYKQSAFLCASLPDDLPEIAFVINGVPLTLGPEDYISAEMDWKICQSLLKPLATAKEVILGYPFLQKYYTMFDYEKKQISFALAKLSSPPNPKARQPGKTGKQQLSSYSPEKIEEMREQVKRGVIAITVPAKPVDVLAELQSTMGGSIQMMNTGQGSYGPQRQRTGFNRPPGY